MADTPVTLLSQWLNEQLPADSAKWLSERRAELATAYTPRALHVTLGMVPRRLGKADLKVSPRALEAAQQTRPGWYPSGWSVADAARVLVLLETAGRGEGTFAERFVDLCRNADVGELIAFYRGLPLYPEPASLEPQAGEGLRTNMRAVFEAVAHHNPYPREQFATLRWNQMVLKALFVGSTLHPIQGLDERANSELAEVMCDYADERWAAGREVSVELWRCVGPFAGDGPAGSTARRALDALCKVLATGSRSEREGAALALSMSGDARARARLADHLDLQRAIANGALVWKSVVERSREHPAPVR